MFRYLHYNNNGEFTNSAMDTEPIDITGINWIADETSDINLTYHDNGSVVPKITQTTSIDTQVLALLEECTLVNLPNPCTIGITREGVYEKETIVGGTAKYSFDTTGYCKVVINALHHLPKEFIINVN